MTDLEIKTGNRRWVLIIGQTFAVVATTLAVAYAAMQILIYTHYTRLESFTIAGTMQVFWPLALLFSILAQIIIRNRWHLSTLLCSVFLLSGFLATNLLWGREILDKNETESDFVMYGFPFWYRSVNVWGGSVTYIDTAVWDATICIGIVFIIALIIEQRCEFRRVPRHEQ